MTYNPVENYDAIASRLEFLRKKARDPQDRSLLEQIAAGVERLAEDATANPVTKYRGLPRRDYDVKTIQAKRRDYNKDFDFFVVMIDIDKFGDFNKKYGQQVGDQVLKATTEILEEGTREYDIVGKGYHLHGEELQVILQAPSKEIAALVVERLRKDLEKKSVEKVGYKVTATFGFTKWDVEKEEFEAAQRRADLRMQEGKQEQRNRIYYI